MIPVKGYTKRRMKTAALVAACAFAGTCVFAATAPAQGMPHESVPYDCTRCHTNLDDRSDIAFDHSELDFELVGQHRALTCTRCHDLADFARADDQCASCHVDVHQGRLYPECETCHSPAGWRVIDPYGAHSRTAFQLFGAHVRLDCDACHEREIVAERAMLSSDCYACHQDDYELALSPNHVEYGFDTRCETCHMQLAWIPSHIRQHPGDFPIFSGTHAGEWGSCADCHVDPGDFIEFSCLQCHEHNQADMDEEHDDVDFYYYDSNGCYGCHPTGIAEGDD
jgi:hypothetical protein